MKRTFDRALKTVLSYAVLGLCAAVMLGPVILMLVGSLKPDEVVLKETSSIVGLFTGKFSFENYKDVFVRVDFGRFMLNSLFITTATVALGLVINSMAGYSFARSSWRGRDSVFALVLALMILPFEAIAVPLFYEAVLINWRNSYQVQIVPFIANAFSIYLFYSYFLSIPRELEEAAEMDGAGPWRTFWTIVTPNAKPAFAAVAVIMALMIWGSYLWPLMVTTEETYRPLPVAIAEFYTLPPINWGDILAFGVMMVAPVMIAFLLFQSWFVRGLASTGLK